MLHIGYVFIIHVAYALLSIVRMVSFYIQWDAQSPLVIPCNILCITRALLCTFYMMYVLHIVSICACHVGTYEFLPGKFCIFKILCRVIHQKNKGHYLARYIRQQGHLQKVRIIPSPKFTCMRG